ncbi:hypothetical protein N7516_000285 [Penicillium verrucosum]|uniref:uncharacterized protein n=1 Tax=Penicillium verrucosum TaxID=60171 RepID=UPI0025451606|nr:uncharacterized protein N7516_000285 [Penicillium verrucosum]KAJ5940117.1 hypothetical protein N7516_000285 [Penicillium verrucosum]
MAETQSYEKGAGPLKENPVELPPLEQTTKGRWERSWPTIACGAGLFSDGYLNQVIGPVGTMLTQIYGDAYTKSTAQQNVSSIVFAGTVVGMLVFGYTSDHWSRKWSLMISTIILFVFAALGAGSYGAGGSLGGMLAALTAYRFFLGIGIGGEYPAGSVGAAENTGELKSGHRNRWFIMFTNFQIDFGFVVAALVSMILVLIFTEKHLHACWRMDEPEEFNRERMHKFPIWLIIKFYWKRLAVVSIIWFLYDFSAYSFGIYSSAWLKIILGDTAPLWKSFGWSTVGVIGFIMAGCYKWLATPENVAAFVVVFGIFSALGEMGPGDNIGLCAAKSSATAIRGQYYSYAAAIGKVGAFVGTYVIPVVQKNAPNPTRAGQDPFFVSSSLCILAAFMAIFMMPEIGQDTITHEDARFRDYLEANGYDTTQMGTHNYQSDTHDQE